MSKTVTIPTDGMNPFVVIFNGVKYVYTPGETVTVPDGVALEIEEYMRWRDKYYGITPKPFGAQPDLSQNDPDAADYVKGRTHYQRLMYSQRYIDYLEVSPIKEGIGIYPLVIAKKGYETFSFDTFLDPARLQSTSSGDSIYPKEFTIDLEMYVKATGGTMVVDASGAFWNSMEYIDDTNYKGSINPKFGVEIYAIRNIDTLHDEYKGKFLENGVYLKVNTDQNTISAGHAVKVSFKVLETVQLDEKYIPYNIPRASTATVGQTIVVKSVDENGKPTEWEAADLPSGGVGNPDLVLETTNEYEAFFAVGSTSFKITAGSFSNIKEKLSKNEEPFVVLKGGAKGNSGGVEWKSKFYNRSNQIYYKGLGSSDLVFVFCDVIVIPNDYTSTSVFRICIRGNDTTIVNADAHAVTK